jgi:cadmium resistance protein CadD (predicted permease)
MTDLFGALTLALVVFAATDVDDLFLLAAFFADDRLRPSAVVLGQYLGIGFLVVVSAAAAWVSLAVPEGYTALLGVIPLALGLIGLAGLRRTDDGGDEIASELRRAEERVERRTHSQMLAVAGVTVANGGDNLGVYIPLFARDPGLIPLYALVFAALTGVWCFVGYRLVRNQLIGTQLRRYGHIALPIVLIGLGLWILAGARVLVR